MTRTAVVVESGALIGGLRRILSDEDGAYRAGQLPVGSYDITA